MANLTFSNKGIPMGRNKTVSLNASSQWSEAEDNYLRMTAEQNMPAGMVAAKLGRTNASVYTRKWTLGIKNNHAVPRIKAPKGVKEVSKSQIVKVKTKTDKQSGMQLFALETGVPIPQRGYRGNEEVRMKLINTLERMNPGQSFVIEKGMLNPTVHLAKTQFEAYRIKTSATSADKKFYRIFRLA
jgi:hypothetical protein